MHSWVLQCNFICALLWVRYAALAARWKEPAKDALDTLILNAVDRMSLDQMDLLEHMPFDPVVKRYSTALATTNS